MPEETQQNEPRPHPASASSPAPASSEGAGAPDESGSPAAKPQTAEEQMALYEESLKESDWGHQPC